MLPPGTGRLTLLALMVGLLTLGALLFPFDFAVDASDRWLALRAAPLTAVVASIGLFIPMGVCEGWLAKLLIGRAVMVTVLVTMDATLLSLIGETLQLWLPGRDSALVDLVANALGGTVGALVSEWIRPPFGRRDGTR